MLTEKFEQERQEIINLLEVAITEIESAPNLEDMTSVEAAFERLKDFSPVIEVDITNKIDELERLLISFDDKHFNVDPIIRQLDLHRPRNTIENQVEYLATKLYIAIFQKATMLYALKRHREDHLHDFVNKVVARLQAIQVSKRLVTN